jgi:hypothetical protein
MYSLNLTCEQISFQQFSGASPEPPFKGQGKEGREGEGKQGGEERRGDMMVG